MAQELDRVRQARRSLAKVREKLLRPTAKSVESSGADVAKAIECLQGLERQLQSEPRRMGPDRNALRSELEGLRADLQQVNALLDGAGRFYQGWSRLVSGGAESAAPNYTAAGKCGPEEASSRVVVHG